MSDLGRKDVTDSVHDTMKPDSMKSTTEKISDSVTGTTDSAAGHVQPDSQKSTAQKMSDAVTGSNTHTTSNTTTDNTHKDGLMDKVKNAVGMDSHSSTTDAKHTTH